MGQIWCWMGQFGTALGHYWTVWDNCGTGDVRHRCAFSGFMIRCGRLTNEMAYLALKPGKEKGTDPSCGVRPSKLIIAQMCVIVKA